MSEELNLLSPEEVSTIKLKISKSHRSQKDYRLIEAMLMEKDLYVVECLTKHPSFGTCSDLMTYSELLLAFTNRDDCSRQMEAFANRLGMDLEYNLRAMAFLGLAVLTDKNGLRLAVDFDEEGPFLMYGQAHYDVAWLG